MAGKRGGKEAFELGRTGMNSSGLPKYVRLLGERPSYNDSALRAAGGMYEFEVVKGNAAYREGEHFYLTASQAERAYFSGR